MYADDTTLLSNLNTSSCTNSSISNVINAELTKITNWLAVNKLSLNAAKTKMMIFHSRQKKLKNNEIPIIKINDELVEHVTQFKFIGCLLDSNLTWTPHNNYVANKLARVTGVITRLKRYVPVYILKSIYNSLFLSHLTYGVSARGHSLSRRIKHLQKKPSGHCQTVNTIHIHHHCSKIWNL